MGCNMSKDEVPERKLEHLADSMVIMTSKGKKEEATARITDIESIDFVPRRQRDSLAKGRDGPEDESE